MKRLLMTAAALALLMTPARGAALIANCTLKANAAVMSAAGDKQPSWTASKDVEVDVYDQQGEWAWFSNIGDEAKDDTKAEGWVLRSSLYKCHNIHPWTKR